MTISLTEDFKTVDELATQARKILEEVQRTNRPVAITLDGKPAAVLLAAAQYEWMLHLLNLSRMLNEAQADVRADRVRPVEEVLKELKQNHGEKRTRRVQRRRGA